MGSASSMNKTVEAFKNKSVPVLFIDVEHFPAGINLEMADVLILYQSFEKYTEQQVVGRCQRPGRTTPLQILKFKYSDE